MKIYTTIISLQSALREYRSKNYQIGFVPTMGALHKGHLSLLKQCLAKDDISVVSIYVNPSQFNDKNDFRNYPRNFQSDLDLLKENGCHIVFLPGDDEMYPSADTREFDFGMMGTIMEGKYRPGHFNGVAQIVTKLFDAVNPHRAYFGRKDFQQLSIIRKLIHDLNYSIEIVECPIIREADGLAMSSRNALLTPDQRKAAPMIYETLYKVNEMIYRNDIPTINSFVEATINASSLLKLEYFQIVDTFTLSQIKELTPEIPVTACIAVFADSVRLIDNIQLIS